MRDRDWPTLKAQAVQLRRQGFSHSQIGRGLDVHKNVAGRWVANIPFDGFSDESKDEQLAGYRDPQTYSRACDLRQAGWSYKMISTELGVAKSTLNSWFRTEPEHEQLVKRHAVVGQLKAVQANRLRQDRLTKKIHDDAVDEMQGLIGDGLSERELFLTGLALYWAEGNKTQNHLAIANCDPQLIRTFTLWVERWLHIDRSQLRGMVYLYPDVDVEAAETYWSEVIGIPRSQFYPAQVDTRTNKSSKKYGTLLYGTVHVKVLGEGTSNLHRKIMGWIAGLGQHVKQTMRE